MLRSSTTHISAATASRQCAVIIGRKRAIRAMTVDTSKGVPKAPFQRPKAAAWPDKSGHIHETPAVKLKVDVFTGDPSARIPPDPYAPHITPSQVRKLAPEQKSDAQSMSKTLRAWNQGAYDNIDAEVGKVVARAKSESEAKVFNAILRSWNNKAYKTIDDEAQARLSKQNSAKRMAAFLREMSPKAYDKVDAEMAGCAVSGIPKAEWRRGGKGVMWPDRQGQWHETPVVKKKLEIHTGDPSELPPPDPYRPNAA